MPKLNFEDLIIFENDDYVLINKPPLMATLDERTEDRKTTSIIALLRNYEPTYQICHRLDKETSGVLAIAKHPEAYRHLAMAFERRKVQKVMFSRQPPMSLLEIVKVFHVGGVKQSI